MPIATVRHLQETSRAVDPVHGRLDATPLARRLPESPADQLRHGGAPGAQPHLDGLRNPDPNPNPEPEPNQVQPHLDGLPVKDRDFHKDYDTVCAHPRGGYRSGGQWWAKGQKQREPECFGPLHPECSEERPDLGWWANASGAPATRVSMRFLRGLDAHKLEHNSKAWRERFFYKEWRQRSKEAPPNLLFRSAPYTDHPVTRAWWGRSPEPDAIIFNSCAWDLPQINRSFYYFPFMVPGYPCPDPPPTMNTTVRIREQRLAQVVGAPCVKRAEVSMTEAAIVQDYGKRLREALILIRRRFRGRLILRSCHSGTQVQIQILTLAPTLTLTLAPTLALAPMLTLTLTLTLALTLAPSRCCSWRARWAPCSARCPRSSLLSQRTRTASSR